jgi:hypothetical protein
MRPFDEIPFEESDYSDVALMVASVREWPAEDFSRELDAQVARRFAAEGRDGERRGLRRSVRMPLWSAGPAVALVAGIVAAVVVVSSGGNPPINPGGRERPVVLTPPQGSADSGARHRAPQRYTEQIPSTGASGMQSIEAVPSAHGKATSGAASSNAPALNASTQGLNLTAAAPVAPGAKQIQSAQISLTTGNDHVDQVAQEVFQVVGDEHGTVQSSHITAATSGSGGGYASFMLSVPTSNLQATMTDLSRLHFAAVQSRTDSSQNVSHQYSSDQRQLNDARALRTSLLKQLAAAVTTQQIDSIKAQLKLAEQQIASWQNTLGRLQHRIGFSNVEVQINENGLPIPVYHRRHSSAGFTIGRALHDAVRVLVVAAGVALIALAVMIPVGLVAALLMWLWVWLRQRRREQALDSAG